MVVEVAYAKSTSPVQPIFILPRGCLLPFFFSCFDLSDVLLLCLVNPVLDGDHLVGEVENDCFAFVCFLDCLLFVFVCSSSW